jgi:hypothetical protein
MTLPSIPILQVIRDNDHFLGFRGYLIDRGQHHCRFWKLETGDQQQIIDAPLAFEQSHKATG